MTKLFRNLVPVGLILLTTFAIKGEINHFTILANKPGAEIQPTMYGLFFEDINYAADGGLYAEMIKNRSFEFPQSFMGWNTFGNIILKDDGPFERNPHYVRLAAASHQEKRTGLDNEGFFGVSFKAGEEYRFSVWARTPDKEHSKIRVELIDPASNNESQVVEQKSLDITSDTWSKYVLIFKPSETVKKGRLRIFWILRMKLTLNIYLCFPLTHGKAMKTACVKIWLRSWRI